MKHRQLALRYARALYGLAKDSGVEDAVFAEMRVLNEILTGDAEIATFLDARTIRPANKVAAFTKMTESIALQEPLKKFVLLLARKNRLPLFGAAVEAYQTISDEAHGVTRGVVRSAATLGPDERKRIAELVSKATKKQVILTYKEDPSLLGGLVAEVGSFTFDDSLTSHLRRMNEQLTRSAQ